MRAEEVRRFEAQADDGEVYEIIEYVNIISTNIGGRTVSTKGTRFHELEDESAVNEIDASTFKIVATNKIVRKIG
jgi:hypothetical protein